MAHPRLRHFASKLLEMYSGNADFLAGTAGLGLSTCMAATMTRAVKGHTLHHSDRFLPKACLRRGSILGIQELTTD